MRKQYHFRESPQGVLAWDVDRLVELAEPLAVEMVAVAEIGELDEAYWFDAAPTCREIVDHMRLVNECDLQYPILLCANGRVMDGMHRVAKALLIGESHIRARRFCQTPSPDFVGRGPDQLPY